MLSPGSPTLNLDVRSRKTERTLVLVMIACLLWSLSLSNASFAMVVFAGICGLISILGGSYWAGWLPGPRRIVRIVWQADGRWLLTTADGRTHECALSPATRVASHLMWLRWIGHASRPLLLVSGDISPQEFRRLVVRLRLDTRSPLDEAIHES